ncbi:MAG: sigma-70 family RNA polymerase sigma factor [Casimicrobiaceae bacterium]
MTAPHASFDYEATLAACARGETAALRELYARDASWLMGVAMRIVRRRELAGEVLHDAFVQIWQKSHTFDSKLGSGRGWIYSVVRHGALTTLRRQSREIAAGYSSFEDIADPAADPLADLTRSTEAQALHRCLQALDEKRRTCILLAYMEGLTQQQIADRLRAPLGTVKAWIRRGLIALKECLGLTLTTPSNARHWPANTS